MAFAVPLKDFQKEASCPLCQDYLRNPVTTECGHNFCSSCIRQRWQDLCDTFPCPVCLHHCPDGNPPRNHQMSDVVDVLKQLLPPRKPRDKSLCTTHGQALDMFCEEDLELLCAQGTMASAHQGHHLVPVGKAAAHYRELLMTQVDLLETYIEDARAEHVRQLSESIAQQPQEVPGIILSGREWRLPQLNGPVQQLMAHGMLLQRQKDVEKQLAENKRRVSDYLFTLQELMSDIVDTCLQEDADFLTRFKSVERRYRELKSPELFPCDIADL